MVELRKHGTSRYCTTKPKSQISRTSSAMAHQSEEAVVGIGVASIIAVMMAIALVQATLEHEMSVLGAQTFQVQKWPAGGFASDAERRRAMRRPPLTLANADAIRGQVRSVDTRSTSRCGRRPPNR